MANAVHLLLFAGICVSASLLDSNSPPEPSNIQESDNPPELSSPPEPSNLQESDNPPELSNPPESESPPEPYTPFRLRIVHNNDLHARFLETDVHGAPCPDELVEQNKCFGGFARIKQAVLDARQEAEKENIPLIFLNAGDTFQGTPYYTLFKWEITAPLIRALGIDVMCLGNHEFDDGIENLVNYLTNIPSIPVVCANLNREAVKELADLPNLMSSKVLNIEGTEIGIVGYLTPDTKKYLLNLHPDIDYIRTEAQSLKAKGIKIIIALGHSGFEKDLEIAREVEEVSLVIGGHSHTFLYSPKDLSPSTEKAESEYPTWVEHKISKKPVPVVQAFKNSKYLGKLTVTFDKDGNVLEATGNPQLLDHTVKKEPILDAEISIWEASVREQLRTVKGYTRTFLAKANFEIGKLESSMANLITDAFLDIGVKYAFEREEKTWTKSTIACNIEGGIRIEIDHRKNYGGALTMGDLMTVMPFGNKLVEIALYGSAIRKILEYSATCYNDEKNVFREKDCTFTHFSGLKVAYDFSRPAWDRVISAETLCIDCTIVKYEPLVDDKIYHVITIAILARSKMIKDEKLNVTELDITDLNAVIHYLEKKTIVYPIEDNRMTAIGFKLNTPTSSSSIISLPQND